MNILHLSDIHFGRNNPQYGLTEHFEKHDQILKELINTVKTLDESLRPEHIVFTGDIAWHGKRNEFEEARIWFERLLEALSLTGKDISFCVGNHDVDLSCQHIDMQMNDDMIDRIDDLYRYENIYNMEPAIYAYNEFCRQIGVIPYAYPMNGKEEYSYSVGYKDISFQSGKTIRLISLNTSLLFGTGISQDKMWLGQEQIKSLIRHGILPVSNDIWYTIALYHHADRFLHPNETTAYEGRCATLPLLTEYVNLLLCGHTESAGRPRLKKQSGGGVQFSAGAAYYSDDHVNSFAMIYVSEKRRGMGFMPYIYDNGWRDYEFSERELSDLKREEMKKRGEMGENAVLICRGNDQTYSIPLYHYEFFRSRKDGKEWISLNNRMDIMSSFLVSYDGPLDCEETPIVVSLPVRKKNLADAMQKYAEYAAFAETAGALEGQSFSVISSEGRVLLSGSRYIADEKILRDELLLREIIEVETFFDVKFQVLEEVTKLDIKKITFLKELAEKGYTSKVTTSQWYKEELQKEGLQFVCECAKKANKFFLKCKRDFTFSIFGVEIYFPAVTVIAGPYGIEEEDVAWKLRTYREGDKRQCFFMRMSLLALTW